MHIYGLRKNKINLEPVPTTVVERAGAIPVIGARDVNLRSDALAPARLTRAAVAFFDYARQEGPVPTPDPAKGPPTVLREPDTGRLRVYYREIVIRFRPKTPEATRKAILNKYGFKVRKANPLARNQYVVYDATESHEGEKLIEVANDWAEMNEVVFATPNLVSEYTRSALPKPHPQQWHLENKGKGGQKKGRRRQGPRGVGDHDGEEDHHRCGTGRRRRSQSSELEEPDRPGRTGLLSPATIPSTRTRTRNSSASPLTR